MGSTGGSTARTAGKGRVSGGAGVSLSPGEGWQGRALGSPPPSPDFLKCLSAHGDFLLVQRKRDRAPGRTPVAGAVGKGWMDQVVAPGGIAEPRGGRGRRSPTCSGWSGGAALGKLRGRFFGHPDGHCQVTACGWRAWAGARRKCWSSQHSHARREILKLVLGRELCTRDSRSRGLG